MHEIDFLKILPREEDEYARRRASMWKEIADSHKSLRQRIDVLEVVPTITDKERRY